MTASIAPNSARGRKSPLAIGLVLAVVIIGAIVRLIGPPVGTQPTAADSAIPSSDSTLSTPAHSTASASQPPRTSPSRVSVPAAKTQERGFADEAGVLDALRARRSGVLVDISVRVKRLLPDDKEGSEHQRFIVELSNGQTLLVAHNTDLAPRVPVKAGESVGLRGQYEWNEQGGVIHWTHHDPRNRRVGGWILHDGKKYE